MNRIDLDDFAWTVIRRKARRMIGRVGLTRSDFDDLTQELALRLWQSTDGFDPGQAHWRIFVTTVVERSAANILRHHQAAKRGTRSVDGGSIDHQVAHPTVDPGRIDLAIDVATVRSRLPVSLQNLCDQLQARSVAEVARSMGLSRTTLQRRVDQLRWWLDDAGLAECG